MNVTTLHNSSLTLEPQIKRTNYRTINGKAIYLKETFDGVQTYVIKGKNIVLVKESNSKRYKAKSTPCWNNLDPVEHEQLYIQYPERFSGYRAALIREHMINNKQTWNKCPAIHS